MQCIELPTIEEGVLNHGSLVSGPFVAAASHMLRLNELSQCNSGNMAIGQKCEHAIERMDQTSTYVLVSNLAIMTRKKIGTLASRSCLFALKIPTHIHCIPLHDLKLKLRLLLHWFLVDTPQNSLQSHRPTREHLRACSHC